MNCKPGELCRIVGMATTPEADGYFVTAEKLIADSFRTAQGYNVRFQDCYGPAWLVKGHAIPWRLDSGELVYVAERAVADCFLRPIRDPGDDADCESKAWLPPVPHKETA